MYSAFEYLSEIRSLFAINLVLPWQLLGVLIQA